MFVTDIYMLDPDCLDSPVIVGGTANFKAEKRLDPSSKSPPREDGQYQAWVSVNGEVLDKALLLLKRMVLSTIHLHPGMTKVIHHVDAGPLTR